MKTRGAIILGIVVVLLIFGVYFPMVAPSVAPQADSGELVTVGYFWSIAHPPGYPLYTFLAHLFTKLPWGQVAWRVNLLSTVLQVSTLFVVYLIMWRMTKSVLAALVSLLTLAFSYVFWLYGLVAEVFPLNNLLAMLVVYVALLLAEKKSLQESGRLPYFLALLFGLGMANHHTIVLIIPAVTYLLFPLLKDEFRKKKYKFLIRWLALTGLFFLVGLLPYLLIIVRAKSVTVPVSWTYPTSLSTLWHLFVRGDYGTFAAVANRDPSLATLLEKGDQIVNYFRLLIDDFGWIGLVLLAIGIVSGLKKGKRMATFLLLGWLFSSVFFLAYANFPIKEFTGTALAILERFYLLPNLFVAMLIGLAANFLLRLSRPFPIGRFCLTAVVLGYVLTLWFGHRDLVDQGDNWLSRELGQNILTEVKPNSLVLIQGDTPTFVTFYVRYVEGYRPDVEILTANQTLKDNSYRYLRGVRPGLDLSLPQAASIAGLVAANLDKAPFYIFGPPPELGSNALASPAGMLFEILRPIDVTNWEQWKITSSKLFAAYQLPDRQELAKRQTFADWAVASYYVRAYGITGDFCRNIRDWDCALSYYKQGRAIDPEDIFLLSGEAKAYQEKGLCLEAEQDYKLMWDKIGDNRQVLLDLYNLANTCFSDTDRAREWKERLNKLGSFEDTGNL